MIDEYLTKLEKEISEINTKLDKLGIVEDPVVLTTTDVSRLLGINKATAIALFKEPDFPKIPYIHSNKVEKSALARWLRRESSIECIHTLEQNND